MRQKILRLFQTRFPDVYSWGVLSDFFFGLFFGEGNPYATVKPSTLAVFIQRQIVSQTFFSSLTRIFLFSGILNDVRMINSVQFFLVICNMTETIVNVGSKTDLRASGEKVQA